MSYSSRLNFNLLRIWLVFFVLGAQCPEAVESSFIQFKPNTEYVYSFHSSTELKQVRTLQAKAKIGLVLVKSPKHENGLQQMYLRFYSAAISDKDKRVLLSEEHNYDQWFSFFLDASGGIGQVYYPRDENEHVIAIKKGIVSLLAANLQHPSGGQIRENGWNYECNETGHEGHHESSYTAKMSPSNDGIIIFTKTRRTHPIPYGKSKHQKEIHYHPSMQLPTLVKIMDSFEAPKDSPPEFQDQFQEKEEKGNIEYPEMQSFSEGQLTFVREAYCISPTMPTDEDLVADSIYIKKVPNSLRFNYTMTSIKEAVSGNLTCMRTAPRTGSHERSHCYQDLVHSLQYIPDGQRLAEIVTPLYQLPLSRHDRDKEDRLNMLDAVSVLNTDASQSLLTDLILLSPKPNKDLVERLIIASTGFTQVISQHYLATLEGIVFNNWRFPDPMQDTEIQRVAVMVLGALASNLWNIGQKAQAESIVVKIENKLGVHDPWTYNKIAETLSKDELDDFHHDTVACIEALGNAAFDRSFSHIQSYTNSSTTHPLLKRAGLHSMRDYHNDKAADILLRSALDEDEHEHVRYEASLLYKSHPNSIYKNVSKLANKTYNTDSNSSEVVSTESVSSPSRHRIRRGFWEGITIPLAIPEIVWKKLIGSPSTGSVFGFNIKNELKIKIAPLDSYVSVDVHDEAYATVLVGLVGEKLDIARARFCFKGQAAYNLNIFKEFGVERISDLVRVYDILIQKVVGNIVRAVDVVVDLFNGKNSIGQLFYQFVDALENIPKRISRIRTFSARAVARLSRLDPDQLPPSIDGVIKVVNKAAQLFSDIKTDVMEFYQAVNEAITVTLPWAADQIRTSIIAISENIESLLKSPLKAIGDIFKGVINIKTAVDAIVEAKMEVQKANFFKQGQKPYWFNLPQIIGDMIKELKKHQEKIRTDLVLWVDEMNGAKDPVKKLTGGTLDSHTLRTHVRDEIESVFDELMEPIKPITDLLDPFFEIHDLVFNSIKNIKEAYQTLKDGYKKSQALVIKLFGPKAHKLFPRKYREPGSGPGVCASGGFYPTDSAGYYEDQGVDLEMSQGAKLVAPFSGIIFKSSTKPDQVILKARGGAFRNTKIFIDNITPNTTFSETQGTNVIAGTEIGIVGHATTCSPPNYIHVSMKKSKPNRLATILDSAFDDDPTAADLAAKEGYVDPSNYLAKRLLELPKWEQICDDYKLVLKGSTVKEGSLLGGKKDGEIKDTSPERAAPPPTATNMPNPDDQPPKRESDLKGPLSTADNQDTTQEALGLPQPKLGSGSPFKNFTLRNLKMSSILAFARKLGLDDTAKDLLQVVKTIVDLVSNKPCVVPESLTNDALRIELQQRGLSSQGDRKILLQRYKQPDDRCPLLQVSLPKNVYCKIDESCLGVECCINIKLFMVSLAFKAFMRFDPCEFQFVFGINSRSYNIPILEAEWGKTQEVSVPLDIPLIDGMELHLRYSIEKGRAQLLVSMDFGFCPMNGDSECMPYVTVLQDSAIPLPICNPDGTFTWPDIDIKEYFSRARMRKLIKETGEELHESWKEVASDYTLIALGIDKELFEDKRACLTPARLSDVELISALVDKNLPTNGNRIHQELRLSQNERSCTFFTLPPFSDEVAEVAYCSLSDNCLRLDCCLEINIQWLKFRQSFRAFIEVDACEFTLTVAFQHLQYKKLLLGYNWGQTEQQKIGAFTLIYSINKLDREKQFEIDFGASVCPYNEDTCIFNIDIIQDYRVPIPYCSTNFSLFLPGKNSLSEFISQVGQNADQQAINILLEFIGIKDKVNDGPCVSTNQEVCSDVSLPPLTSTLTCVLYNDCLGVQCCVDLDLQFTVLSSNVWMVLDPCHFTLSMGFGKWSLTFTLFDYHWGMREELKVGKALTLIYTIDKLSEDKVFILDLALSLCLPESDCDTTPSIDILKETRVPIPICNENTTFSLPGDGTVAGFLYAVGSSAAESTVEAVLTVLGFSEIINHQELCVHPQVTLNGWHRICARNIRLPHLPRNLICTLPEKCLGFDCCFELPIPGLTPLSTKVSFIFDPCNYQLSLGLGSWSKDLQILSYHWGQQREVTIGKPLTLRMSIDKIRESFSINLEITFCLDGDCITTQVLKDTLIPMPLCNPNASFVLPGDGSFATLARDLNGNIGELAIQAGLRKLGIQQYVGNTQSDKMDLAPAENKCPLMRVPAPTNLLTCIVDDQCLGLHCWASLDLIFTKVSITTWAILDPCENQLLVGFGSWSTNVTVFEHELGVERTAHISESVYILFNIDRLAEQKEFVIDLSLTSCIDDICRPIKLLQGAHVPIPNCNPNATFSLPGDGSIAGFLDTLTAGVTDAAVDLVLDSLGLKEFLSRDVCSLPQTKGNESCPLELQSSSSQFSCSIDRTCTGSLYCCLNMDLKVIQLSSKAWFVVDPCDYKVSIGFGMWYFNKTLFSIDWGEEEEFSIGNAINVRFSMDKLDGLKEYEVSLTFSLLIDDTTTDFPVMEGMKISIPSCNSNVSLSLPGDGTVKGFLRDLGDNVGQSAIELVFRKLNLKDVLSGGTCASLAADMETYTRCPTISLPSQANIIQCSIDDHCLGVQCCVHLDFTITTLIISTQIKVDPCNYQLHVQFGTWEGNFTLFSYTWGQVKSVSFGEAVTLSYAVDKVTENNVFSVSLNVKLCIDDTCKTTPVLNHVRVPIPVCNIDAVSYILPGDGTIAGFITELGGHIGDSAVDLVMAKYGLDPFLHQRMQCDRGTPHTLRTVCPDASMHQLPDQCSFIDSCLGIRCCLEMDFKIVTRTVSAWLILDPCNFTLSVGFENWEHSITLFHYPMGDFSSEVINSVLTLRWRVAKITDERQYEFSLYLVLCLEGTCNTVTVIEGSRLPVILCSNKDPFTLLGTGTVSGFLDYLGGNIGQFAIDAALRHLKLGNFLTGKACSYQRQGVCSSVSGDLGNCSIIGEFCTELHCCLDLDLQIADVSTTAWFKFDPCNLNFTIGLETWSLYGSSSTYDWGKEATVMVAPGMNLSFSIHKMDDWRAIHVMMNLEYCVDELCTDIGIQQTIQIPVCHQNVSNSTFSSSGGFDKDTGINAVANVLNVSTDILLSQPCSGPPERISPSSAGCSSPSLPASVLPYCSINQTCIEVSCCLTFDFGTLQRSFLVWVRLDPCASRFSFGFERWSYTEVLTIGTLQTHSQEKETGVLKIRYNIERPHETVYDVDMDIRVCWQGSCDQSIVILQDAIFSGSHCGDGGRNRRKRRNVEDLSNDSQEDELNINEFILSGPEKAIEYFRKLLHANSSVLNAQENILTRLQPEKARQTRMATSGIESRRAFGPLIFGNEDNSPVPGRKKRAVSVALMSGGASLFDLSLTPGADSGTWQGDVIIGGGLTQKGLNALADRIANMTIGELEAMLDLQNIDPVTIVKLMKDLGALYRTFVREFIDVSVAGTAEDNFKQFDIVLSGTIPFPRRELTFFPGLNWGTLVGGIIYLEFSLNGGGFFDMKIPVSFGLVSMKATGGIRPMVGSFVVARITIGLILYGELELKADVLHTSFPIVAEISFAKFPLDVGLKMDIVMMPLIIRLSAKVTLGIPFFPRVTLFKRNLWRYQQKAIMTNIFDISKKHQDESPPEVVAYSTPVDLSMSEQGAPRTTHCSVEQVPGLDYTEPAFELEMVAVDDKSMVTFFYAIGTVPGGSDVSSKTEYGGPSAIITQTLLGGQPLYFTVYAVNSGGGTSTGTCSLPTFDITLPTGRITPDFLSTSHPHILRASAVVYDDSVILRKNEGVGLGPEIWGDQIIPWHTVDITERENVVTSINDFHYFTAAKKGRLISTPISTIIHKNPNFCARDCLALPETTCLSINYDYESFQCELLQVIEGHGVEIHENGVFTHFERLGVGHAVEFNHNSLLLHHNNVYYFNIELLNYVGYENIISSVGILADFTPPEPGLIVNASRDEVVHEPCDQFTPDEWKRRCIEDTPLDNHRYIIDGPGSMTVFNGYEKLRDLRYTRSNTFMAANWDGIHDDETGIYGYTWSIGNAVCDDDVSKHIDPHAHLFDESEWHYEGLVVNVHLSDGAYFITVRALNKVEFGGPMVISVCHSTPLIIDNSPPIIYDVENITYDSAIGRFGLQVKADDPESHLREFHVAIGRTPKDTSLCDWEALAVLKQLSFNFKLPNGIPCWVIVKAVNKVDLSTTAHADEPFLADDTPPIAGNLFDGPFTGRDLVFTKDRNEICGNWYSWVDPETGIYSYMWAVGNRPGLSNVMNFIELSRREHVACSGYVTLQHGETYYSTLVAFHGGLDKLNVTASSDGVSVDLTPPVQGSVFDGLLQGPTDSEFCSTPATVSAQWQGFHDPESGIEDYQVTVYRKHDDSGNATSDLEVIHEAESVGNDIFSIEWHHFHLHHKDQVYINLRTINQALNHIDTPTNGILVDLTPPALRSIGDGMVVGQDADFQTHNDSLAVYWDYFDEESGIASFELTIYEMRHGNRHKIFPADLDPNSFEVIPDVTAKSHVQHGLALSTGAVYITRVKARNHAKLIASHDTTGIKVDPTPPVMRYVHGGNLDGEIEAIFHGYVYQNSHSSIKASWLGSDGQSGIKNYWVSVSTAPKAEDVQAFTSLGSKSSGVLLNLDLQLTNESTCSNQAFTIDCCPVYYVCVKSENGAGAFSEVVCSSPIKIVKEDQTGYVTDGPGRLEDTDTQLDRTTVTIWFDDFESQLHGISHYEWAVGTTPGGEDIQPLTSDGIVPGSDPHEMSGLAGQGKAQSPLPLRHGVTYYSTVRAITNGDNVLETVSNGFTVDVTSPSIIISTFGQHHASVHLSFDNGESLYQSFTDSVSATWDVHDLESNIVSTVYSVGHYPGGSNVFPFTQTNKTYIPASLIKPAERGLPNILTVRTINSVGLKQNVATTSLTVDTTPPRAGKVSCPGFIHATSVLKCSWSDFLDAESGIEYVHIFVGTAEGRDDIFLSEDLPGYFTYYTIRDLNLVHNTLYYVTVEAFNYVSQSTYAFSSPIEIDDTPPSHGKVIELSGVYELNHSDPDRHLNLDCSNAEDCIHLDGECTESINQIQILWEPFTDEDTRITKYEVALGTTPGGTQIKSFYEVSRYQTSEIITNIDLSDKRRVYATVRGYNEAGLTTTAVSNGVYVSRFSAGLQPLQPFIVKDGITDKVLHDLDFQTSLDELSASWDFSGDPCPIRNYKWAIYRIDGKEIQSMTDVGEQTSGTNTDVEMLDGETYFTVVQATNALNITITIHSDGLTVKREPLIPGHVYDGLLVGFDLTYQKETDTISASWSGFGQGAPTKTNVEHTGNDELTKDNTTEQAVDYYKVAVGTDRRYPKTRENIIPFTYVGQNTTVTFRNLDLEALKDNHYFTTVRGYSASLSTAEVTSTGIVVGVDSKVLAMEIKMPKYLNSLSRIRLQWDSFTSTLPMFLYSVGLGKASSSNVSPEDIACLAMLLSTAQSQATFDESEMHFVGKDTYREIAGLNLTQNGSYFVTVVGMNEGGQCNSSTGHFLVDVTPPIEGRLRGGPFYDVPMTYTDSKESIHVVWEDYSDEESGIKSFKVLLLEAASCDTDDTLTPVPGQEWLVLSSDLLDFTFVDLTLETDHPYFVQLLAVNHAGGSTLTQVGPIFEDESQPTAGLVVDGLDYMMDLTDISSRNQVSGTILHHPNPDGPHCPQTDMPFTDPQWLAMDFNGLWNMKTDNLNLEYHSQQVFVSDERLILKMERDTQGPNMLSGAYITNAKIVRSSEYEFDLLAASPDLQSVTSILFWDGPDGVIGEYDFDGPTNWLEGICKCCFLQPFNQSECQQCNCEDFLGKENTTTDRNTTSNSTTDELVTIEADEIKASNVTTTDKAQVTNKSDGVTNMTLRPWTIQKKDGDDVSDEDSGRWTTQRACGLQIYPNGEASGALLWCRHYEDEWPMTSHYVSLDFDPSLEEHHYSIHFNVMPSDANEDEWSFEIYIDGVLLSSLTGIPVMSPSTKLILHIFNRDNYIPDLQNPFNPPAVMATIRNLRMPPDSSELCRYGLPFRSGTSPMSRYFAGVGSEAGKTDIVAFREISRPCTPCIKPCDRYQCNQTCTVDTIPVAFTLTNLTLPNMELIHLTTRNSTNDTSFNSRDDGLRFPFFLTVKAVLGNGEQVTSSSNGFYVDDTPAELDAFFYLDINHNEYQPTWFQSSNSTIKALWSFIDMQSKLKEYYWAIGTSRGAVDLQDFVSVGLDQAASNDNLEGLLHHNTTYYVSLKCINGAGLETLVQCDGITVLFEKPSTADVNVISMFSQRFEEEVYPADIEKSNDPTSTGTSWSQPEDKSISQFEYCVSSSVELVDDIVPCMVVGTNSSGSVAIKNGLIIITADERQEIYNISDFQVARQKPDSDTIQRTAKFNMEPGKSLYSWMKICNSAYLCETLPAGTTTILGEEDIMVTSSNGSDILLTVPISRRRRKRAVDNHFEISIATTGGLHKGGSLILGLLDENKTNEYYTSDANPDYVSYISNPLNTIQWTSRVLRNRIRFVHEPLFYVTSVGQTELQGPLIINISLNTPGNWTEAKPRLLYWDSEHSEWRDVARTCSGVEHVTYIQEDYQFSVEVCATRGKTSSHPAASQKRHSVNSTFPIETNTHYFSHETEFALAEVLNTIPNHPPEIVNPVDIFLMDEDEGTLVYTFMASDPEDDILIFELGLDDELTLGSAAITDDGIFTFTPCPDCYGKFTLQIRVRETQTVNEIKPLHTILQISVEVQPVNDNPFSYVALNGQVAGNGRNALLKVEQNTGSNRAYRDLEAVIGAYDIDINDKLMFRIQPPLYGKLRLTDEVRSAPQSQNCSQGSHDSDNQNVLPCGLEMPQHTEEMSWVSSIFTYTPNNKFHGMDSFLVLSEDNSGAVSQLLKVEIAVLMNPCINEGVCGGPIDDPNCTSSARSSGFDSYFCVCELGWVGDHCETDYDDCVSTPCEFPHVCYDKFRGIECACPLSDPLCDGLHWRFKVIIAVSCSVAGLVIVALVIFRFYKRKYTKSFDLHMHHVDEDQFVVTLSSTAVSRNPTDSTFSTSARSDENKSQRPVNTVTPVNDAKTETPSHSKPAESPNAEVFHNINTPSTEGSSLTELHGSLVSYEEELVTPEDIQETAF